MLISAPATNNAMCVSSQGLQTQLLPEWDINDNNIPKVSPMPRARSHRTSRSAEPHTRSESQSETQSKTQVRASQVIAT